MSHKQMHHSTHLSTFVLQLTVMFYFPDDAHSTWRLTYFAVLSTDVASVFCHIINALRVTTFRRQGKPFNSRFFKSHSLIRPFSPLEFFVKSRCYTSNEDES